MSQPMRMVSAFFAGFLLTPFVGFAQPEPPPFTPPEGVRYRQADILSEGTRMRAEVFTPESAANDAKLPTIILCHGWGGVARQLRPEAIAFARAGLSGNRVRLPRLGGQ